MKEEEDVFYVKELVAFSEGRVDPLGGQSTRDGWQTERDERCRNGRGKNKKYEMSLLEGSVSGGTCKVKSLENERPDRWLQYKGLSTYTYYFMALSKQNNTFSLFMAKVKKNGT